MELSLNLHLTSILIIIAMIGHIVLSIIVWDRLPAHMRRLEIVIHVATLVAMIMIVVTPADSWWAAIGGAVLFFTVIGGVAVTADMPGETTGYYSSRMLRAVLGAKFVFALVAMMSFLGVLITYFPNP